jgi:ABC-type maltose transport system permease subunit
VFPGAVGCRMLCTRCGSHTSATILFVYIYDQHTILLDSARHAPCLVHTYNRSNMAYLKHHNNTLIVSCATRQLVLNSSHCMTLCSSRARYLNRWPSHSSSNQAIYE